VASRWSSGYAPSLRGPASRPQTFTGPDGSTITIDKNGWPPAGPSVPPFFATAGYGLTTGFGSPHADRFVAPAAAP